MKRLAIGFAILIVILTGAILIVPGFLNWNEYKIEIERTASAYSGRTVTIRGDISLSLLPTAALSARDVSVSNLVGGRAEHMLSLKSLDVKVSFPSVISFLFGGKIKVEKFILVDPVIALEVLNDGRVNWDMAQDSGSGNNDGEEGTSSADISLDKFQIVNGQISFENMSSGRKELLRKINANVKVKSVAGPFEIAGSAKYKGLDAQLSLGLGKNRPGKKIPVTLKMALLNDRVKMTVIGGGIASGDKASFSGKLAITASDAGDFLGVMERVKGRKPSAAVKFDQDFALDTILGVQSSKASITDLHVRMGQSRGQGTAEVSFGNRIKFLAALAINKLDMDKLLAAYALLTVRASPDGSEKSIETDWLNRLSGKVDVKLGALKYNGKVASQMAVKLLAKDGVINISTLQARMPGGSTLSFTGQVTESDHQGSVLTGNISVNASNLRGLLSWLKQDVRAVPSGQLAQFSVKSGLKLTPDLLQLFTIRGKLDAMSFKGGVSYALRCRSSYGINLDLRNLNLDSYRGSDDVGKGRTPARKSDIARTLALLDEFDARYKISLANFTFHDLKIRSGKLEGLLLGGKLEARKISLTDVAGLDLAASGTARNFSGKPEFTVKLSANAKSLSPLMRLLKHKKIFDRGRADSLRLDQMRPGQLKLKASVSATFEKMDIDLKSRIGDSTFDVKGIIRSATLKKFPDIGSADLDIDSRTTSLGALIDQFDLPLTRPGLQDDRPLHIKGRLKLSPDLVDVDGKINIAAGEISLKGRRKGKGATASMDMVLDLRGSETREFIRGLGIDFQPSSLKLGPIAVKFKATGSGDQYALSNIVGDVGPVKLSGGVKIDLAPSIPYLDINLKTGNIPLHDFLKKAAAPGGKVGKKTEKYGQWNRQDMDLSLLSAYNGRARMSAASLRYNGYIFEKPVFELNLKDGILSLDNFTGRLFGGDVALSGSFGTRQSDSGNFDGNPKPEMTLDIALKKASLIQATKSSAGITPITGFFDLSGKFTGQGRSQYDMMSSLSGDGLVVAGPGMINGIDIPALSKQLSEMNSNNAFANLLGVVFSGGQTSYKGGESAMVAQDGRIEFSPFDIELDGAKSKVKLDLDLLNWTIRSDGRMYLAEHPNAPPIGVTVKGNISNPDVIFKTGRLKKYVGAKVASQMLQNLIGGGDGLEGIFGNPPKKKKPIPAPTETVKPPPLTGPKTPAAKQGRKPANKPEPAEDFGKRLLQKLFSKEKKPASKNKGGKP